METVTPLREPGRIELIALGISTGGPNALREVFADLSPDIKYNDPQFLEGRQPIF